MTRLEACDLIAEISASAERLEDGLANCSEIDHGLRTHLAMCLLAIRRRVAEVASYLLGNRVLGDTRADSTWP